MNFKIILILLCLFVVACKSTKEVEASKSNESIQSTENEEEYSTSDRYYQDGTIRGMVKDTYGNPLQGVQVYIEELGRGATTDEEGNYIILNVQLGTYDVKCAMDRYSTNVFENIGVHENMTKWLNIVMVEDVDMNSNVNLTTTNSGLQYIDTVLGDGESP